MEKLPVVLEIYRAAWYLPVSISWSFVASHPHREVIGSTRGPRRNLSSVA
jgi:hypothetical protein